MATKGFVIFCDDIREEIGNKTSYMGAVGSFIELHPDAPGIARLSVGLIVNVRGANVIRMSGRLRSDPPVQVSLPDLEEQEITKPEDSEGDWQLKVNILLNGLPITRETRLFAEFEVDGEPVIGDLLIRKPVVH